MFLLGSACVRTIQLATSVNRLWRPVRAKDYYFYNTDRSDQRLRFHFMLFFFFFVSFENENIFITVRIWEFLERKNIILVQTSCSFVLETRTCFLLCALYTLYDNTTMCIVPHAYIIYTYISMILCVWRVLFTRSDQQVDRDANPFQFFSNSFEK